MRTKFLPTFLTLGIILISSYSSKKAYAAVDQILNSNFFQNPAELKQTNLLQFTAGTVFIVPKLTFNGETPLGAGRAQSKVYDSLPYILTAYRLTERFVLGINATPSVYGHINWPQNSILRQSSTTTHFLYYRGGLQTSYQFSDKLSLGLGINLEYNKLGELNFFIGNLGNQVNKIKGTNCTGDLGLYYQINSNNYLTLALYTGVNTYGQGSSSLGATTVQDFSLNINQAPVAYIGLQHWLDNAWIVEGKLYWSGWSIEKNVNLINTTTGTFIIPTNWKDTWSYQVNTRYAVNDKLAFLGSLLYETNAAPLSTNAVAYPLSNSGFFSSGLDLSFNYGWSTQLIYSYGGFIPKAKINSRGNRGKIAGVFQSAIMQLSCKI